MCGLCGIVYADPQKSVDRAILHRMTNRLAHRGPDGEGYFVEPGVGFGFRRLSIIDLPHGDQPLSNEDGSVTVVCNGEIYNYKELRQQLQGAGHRFRTNSDVEVIVHLYEDHGVDCLGFLRGMFSFAIWDGRLRRFILARDRFGIKPISYALTQDALFFGSEFKAILAGCDLERQIDYDAMRELFETGFILAPKTLFTTIQRLPPSHYLVFENGHHTIHRYWDLGFPSIEEEPSRQSASEWADALRAKLEESVRLHLRSDVPVASYLSSGVDSSAVTALMSWEISHSFHTFSVAFEDPLYNEVRENNLLPDYTGFNLHKHITTCATGDFDLIPKLIWHREDPSLSAGGIPHLVIARSAAEHVKVVLTGEGSDEIFGGYHWYRVERLLQPFLNLPLGLRRLIAGISFLRKKWSRSCRALAAPAKMDLFRYLQIIDNATDRDHRSIFSKDLSILLNSRSNDREYQFPLPKDFEQWSRFSQLQYLEIYSRLSDYITRTLDAATMAFGLEARVPFLDHELVELCSRIPPNLKMQGLNEKYILRQALKGVLPPDILNRRKRGLAAPPWPWQGRLPEFVEEALSEKSLHRKGYFNPRHVRNLLLQHRNGNENYERELFGVLSVQIWDDLFVQGGAL